MTKNYLSVHDVNTWVYVRGCFLLLFCLLISRAELVGQNHQHCLTMDVVDMDAIQRTQSTSRSSNFTVTTPYGPTCTSVAGLNNNCTVDANGNIPTPASINGTCDACPSPDQPQSNYMVPVLATYFNETLPTTAHAAFKAQLALMNTSFCSQGIPIQFYEVSTSPRVVASADFDAFDTADDFTAAPSSPTYLDVFIPSTLNGSNFCFAQADLPQGPVNGKIVLNADCLTSSFGSTTFREVFFHEVGHILGLFHTHGAAEIVGFPPSSTAPTNYATPSDDPCTTGDFIADTGADPNLSAYGNNGNDVATSNAFSGPSTCATAVSGTTDDAGFNSIIDFSNLMSYNNFAGCRPNFTDCQKAKMVDALTCFWTDWCDTDIARYHAGGGEETICINSTTSINLLRTCVNWYSSATGGTVVTTGNATLADLNITAAGTYDFYLEEINEFAANCRKNIQIIVLPETDAMCAVSCPTITIATGTVVNPTSCTMGNGSIEITGLTAGTTYTLDYLKDGTAVAATTFTASGTTNVISNLGAGAYTGIKVTDGNTCPSNEVSATLSDPGMPTITMADSSNPTTCGGTDGSITIAGLDATASYSLAYQVDGTAATTVAIPAGTTTHSISGLASGTYTAIQVTLNGCVSNQLMLTLMDPGGITLSVPETGNPTSCGGGDGFIDITGLNAANTYTLFYQKDGVSVSSISIPASSSSYRISGLSTGVYSEIHVSDNSGCSSNFVSATLSDPNMPAITLGTVTNPSTCGGSDGSMVISGLDASLIYKLFYLDDGTSVGPITIDAGMTTHTISNLDAGTYSQIYLIGSDLCKTNFLESTIGFTGGNAIAAPAVVVTESTCVVVGGTPSGGSIAVPTGSCPIGTVLEYSVNGGTFSATLPTYTANSAMTVSTRCTCSGELVGTATSVTTMPGSCPVDNDGDLISSLEDPDDNNPDANGNGIIDGVDVEYLAALGFGFADADGDGIADIADTDQTEGTDANGNGIIDSFEIGGGQASIPTMSQWGLMIFGLLVLNLGIMFLYRREELIISSS